MEHLFKPLYLKLDPNYIDECLEWVEDHRDGFEVINSYFRSNFMPKKNVEHLNSFFKPRVDDFDMPLVLEPHLMLMAPHESIMVHVDKKRDCALNILLRGSGKTSFVENAKRPWYEKNTNEYENKTLVPYEIGIPMLFNTQVPHGVTNGPDERIMLSCNLTISYARAINNYYDNRLIHPQFLKKW